VELELPLVHQPLSPYLVQLDTNYIKELVFNVLQEPVFVLSHLPLNVQQDTLYQEDNVVLVQDLELKLV